MPVKHIPVLLNEVVEYLNLRPGDNFIDCTFGQGGHVKAVLSQIGVAGKVLGIDADQNGLELFKQANAKITENLILVNDNFVNLKNIYEQYFPYTVNAILYDLGLSSVELDSSGRGFSFRFAEPLDMRFDAKQQRLTAAEILNKYGPKTLLRIFVDYGEISKPKAKTVIEAILRIRGRQQFETTDDLVKIILLSLYPDLAEQGEELNLMRPFKGKRRGIHPATQFFQALRIEVNNELEHLKNSLPQAVELLAPGGRLVVISFHSLEDRIVKNYFKGLAREGSVKILTKKPIIAGEQEVSANPRSRSAKLRVIERIKT